MSQKTNDSGKKRQVSRFFSYLSIAEEYAEFKRLIGNWLDYCQADGLSPLTIYDYSDKISRFGWWYCVHSGYGEKLGYHPKFVTTEVARAFASYVREPQKERWAI
jgi:hypothetical protein